MGTQDGADTTKEFRPKFTKDGLIACITTDARDGAVLMFAYMNQQSLDLTIKTGEVHYWSRSRQELWHKGATSGNIQKVVEIQIDCDQDCILIKAEAGPACHTGRKSCFYRSLETSKTSKDGTISLEFID